MMLHLKNAPIETSLVDYCLDMPLINPHASIDDAFKLAYAPIVRDLSEENYKEGVLLFAMSKPVKWGPNVPGIQQGSIMHDGVLKDWFVRMVNLYIFGPLGMSVSVPQVSEFFKLRFNEYKHLHLHKDAPKTVRSKGMTVMDFTKRTATVDIEMHSLKQFILDYPNLPLKLPMKPGRIVYHVNGVLGETSVETANHFTIHGTLTPADDAPEMPLPDTWTDEEKSTVSNDCGVRSCLVACLTLSAVRSVNRGGTTNAPKGALCVMAQDLVDHCNALPCLRSVINSLTHYRYQFIDTLIILLIIPHPPPQ